MYMLPKGLAIAHHKQRDPYILKLLTQTEKVKGTEQKRERERETNPNPKLLFKTGSNWSFMLPSNKDKGKQVTSRTPNPTPSF